jgi:histidinol dehydrogenase
MTVPIWKTSEGATRGRLEELKRKLSLSSGALSGEGERALESVRTVLRAVRVRGDQALIELTERFDGCRLEPSELRVSEAEIDAAYEAVPAGLLEAIREARGNIERYQRSILVKSPEAVEEGGMSLKLEYRPVASAGVYVPGGTAPLCSTVLMAAVPAKVAGVGKVVVMTPPGSDGRVSPDRLVAARESGCEAVYRGGGAQAVAALAYGTETVPKVDMVVGPGNLYVTLAKREVFGEAGIDLLGGPSEVVIVADGGARAEWVALDMLSQAEHAPGSAVLLTDSEALAASVESALAGEISGGGRAELAARYIADYSAIVVCGDLEECVRLASELAPEHLEVMTADAERVAGRIENAGAVFIGPYSPVAVGDYWAGPSHVLPTSGTARFSSGLSANTFLRARSVIRLDREALDRAGGALEALSGAEGLESHGRSVSRRLEEGGS